MDIKNRFKHLNERLKHLLLLLLLLLSPLWTMAQDDDLVDDVDDVIILEEEEPEDFIFNLSHLSNELIALMLMVILIFIVRRMLPKRHRSGCTFSMILFAAMAYLFYWVFF
jgi:hypothetical protein